MPLLDNQGRRFITEHEKMEIIRTSILNLGRLLPDGMELTFYHEAGAEHPSMDIIWPEGSITTAHFTNRSPVYHVPMVNAINSVLDELGA